jgi:hypothetical protein
VANCFGAQIRERLFGMLRDSVEMTDLDWETERFRKCVKAGIPEFQEQLDIASGS